MSCMESSFSPPLSLSFADKVMFDNSYSYLTTKKIRYSVYITEPIEDVLEEQL